MGASNHGGGGRSEDAGLAAALAEPCDLTRAERLHIIAALRDLRRGAYWELLGIRGDPSDGDIKRAYFELSKRYHPDRFFGRDLGSFGKRIDELFRGIKAVYDQLGNANKRAAYAAANPPPPADRQPIPSADPRLRRNSAARGPSPAAAAPPSPPADEARQRRLDTRRAELAAKRRSRLAPKPPPASKAQSYFDAGIRQLQDQDIQAAARSIELALAHDPDNRDYADRHAEVMVMAAQQRVRGLMESAQTASAQGQLAQAAKLFAEASDLVPTLCNAALRAAESLEAAGHAAEALRYAQRAVTASPKRKAAHLLVARLLESAGQRARAVEHLQAALALDATDAHVKKTLKQWSRE